jgi:hypothetical protein
VTRARSSTRERPTEPSGSNLQGLKEFYFLRFPDGRERQSWPGLTYVRARPTWIRYSDFNKNPPEIAEFDLRQLTNVR